MYKRQLWGWSDKSGEVKIKTSWSDKIYVSSISERGKWEVDILTPSAGGPYNIMFDDGDKLFIDDVYLGEVWLCSGQSNMEMPVKGLYGCLLYTSLSYERNRKLNLGWLSVAASIKMCIRDSFHAVMDSSFKKSGFIIL